MCQWHINGRRELSRSYLAGRRSRPDRREGCQAPCPPIRGTKRPSCPRSNRTAGQENGGKGVGPACRGRRGKGGGEWTLCVHVQRRPPARLAVREDGGKQRQRHGLRMPRCERREVRQHVPLGVR